MVEKNGLSQKKNENSQAVEYQQDGYTQIIALKIIEIFHNPCCNQRH